MIGGRIDPATVSLRRLSGEPDEMAALQRVFDDAPRYAQLLTGAPPGAADAQSTYTILPDGKTYDDKFVVGVFDGAAMVGCIDVIRGWPEAGTAHVGLLLVAEAHEHRGIGRAAVARLEAMIVDWGTCTSLRLGVLRDNARAHRFWLDLGFAPTGEVRPYRYGSVSSETVVYRKPLAATAGPSSGRRPGRTSAPGADDDRAGA